MHIRIAICHLQKKKRKPMHKVEVSVLSICPQTIGLGRERSHNLPASKAHGVLGGFFSSTWDDEKLKLNCHWSHEMHTQNMSCREVSDTGPQAKKIDVRVAGRQNPRQLCEQSNLRNKFYWMQKLLRTCSPLKLRQDLF